MALMAYRGPGERTADTSAVVEVERESLLSFREEVARAQPWAEDDESVREVVAAGEVGARSGHARFFAVRDGGRLVSAAQLNSDGRIAEVDDVATLPASPAFHKCEATGERVIEITYDMDKTNAGEVLAAVQGQGFGIVEVSTREADLEDVFVSLTSMARDAA